MNPINVAWKRRVDHGRFECRVEQQDKQVVFPQADGSATFDDRGTVGRLIVKVIASNEVILDEKVPLIAGAIFGPDLDDVARWQKQCIAAIDQWLTRHGEPIPLPPATPATN